MDNDRIFAAYALLLFFGVVTLLTTLLVVNGRGFPAPLAFAEHVALGLSWRFAYKWIGGVNRADWSVTSDRVREPEGELLPAGGDTAGAMS